MSLLSGFFAKPAFSVQPIGAEWAEDCERLHGASFAFGWSKVDFESYLTDPGVIADGALANGGKLLGGFIMSRLTPPDSEILTFAVDPARRGGGLGRIEVLDDFTVDAIKDALSDQLHIQGLTAREFLEPQRIAVTGQAISTGIYESLEMLGKDDAVARYRQTLARLAEGWTGGDA